LRLELAARRLGAYDQSREAIKAGWRMWPVGNETQEVTNQMIVPAWGAAGLRGYQKKS
jgi:hypothetical protein